MVEYIIDQKAHDSILLASTPLRTIYKLGSGAAGSMRGTAHRGAKMTTICFGRFRHLDSQTSDQALLR